LRRFRRLALTEHARGDAKARKPDSASCFLHQYMGWIEVLVDEAPFVQPAQRGRESYREAQDSADLHGRADQAFERLAPGIAEQQHRAPALMHKLYRPRSPRLVEVVLQRVFVSEAIEAVRRWVVSGGQHCQNCIRLAVMSTEDAFTVLPQHPE